MNDRNPNDPGVPEIIHFDQGFDMSETQSPPGDPGGSALTDGILGQDEPEPTTTTTELPPEAIVVQNMTAALVKAVKAAQLYPVENPMCQKFAGELMTRINEAFQSMDVIRISVGKTKRVAFPF